MRDELVIEEMAVRAMQEKMDEAFRAAMERAISKGEENTSTIVSKKPGTKNPRVVFAQLGTPPPCRNFGSFGNCEGEIPSRLIARPVRLRTVGYDCCT